jgi:urease accessory protein
LIDRIEIARDGRPIFLDAIHLSGDIEAQLFHPARGDGCGALATLILAAENAETMLQKLRDLAAENSGSRAGVSLLAPDLLVCRALAHDSFDLRRFLLPVLDHLTGCALPICWRL